MVSIIEQLKRKIEAADLTATAETVGTVSFIGDGIARVSGLSQAKASEMLEFPGGVMGVVLNLEQDSIGVILLGEEGNIKQGDKVKSTGRIYFLRGRPDRRRNLLLPGCRRRRYSISIPPDFFNLL